MLTPNATENDWLSSVATRSFIQSTIAFGLLDPDFTTNEQKLPLQSTDTSKWMVNNDIITI
jgi:hypothetical protein